MDTSKKLPTNTAGAACHRAEEGEHQNHAVGKLRPVVDVADAEARCGDDGRHIEEALVQAFAGIVAVERQDVEADYQRADHDDAEVVPQLLRLERLLELARDNQDIDREVDAEQHHKHGDDGLQIVRVIRRHVVVVNAEAACAGVGERYVDRVEKSHSAAKQQDAL